MNSEKLIILGHINPDVDSIISGLLLEYYINNNTSYKAEFVIPDQKLDNDTISICNRFSIPFFKHQRDLTTADKKIILVDHFERDLENKEIVAIIDHHPTSKIVKTPFYVNEKISSTALLIVEGREEFFSKELLKLAILATYVDTASFNSIKARDEDKIWAEHLCNKYNFDKEQFYEVGLMLTDLTNLEAAAFTGLKKYNIKLRNIEVSSLQINGKDNNKEKLDKIKDIIIDYFIKNELDVFVLIIHDMSKMKSSAFKIFKDGIETIEYDQYTSRGNIIIPELEKELINHNFEINKIKEKVKLKKQSKF